MSGNDEPNTAESFVENVPLTDVFGSHPKARIVAAMLSDDADGLTAFSANEITRITGLDQSTLDEHVSALRSYGVLEETDEIEDTETYRLAGESAVVDQIRRLNDELLEQQPTDESE